MGKSKDLATGETRFVNTSGDTMTGDLTIDTNTFHVDVADNRVGIGTTAPTNNLTIIDGGATPYGADATLLLDIKRNTTNTGATNAVGIRLANNSNGFNIKYGGAADKLDIIGGSGNTAATFRNDGGLTLPYQPCFRARGSASWTTLAQANGVQVMNLGTEEFDQGGHYSTTTYRFTAPVAGKYFLRLHAYVRLETQDDDGNHAYAQIYKNNAGAGGNASIFGYNNNGDSDQMANVTTIMDMAANDFATAVLSPANGSSSYYGAATYFSGFLVG